jgi:predicted permease
VTLGRRLAEVWRTLFRRSRLDADLEDELQGYLRAAAERKVRGGVEPAAARREAEREMGHLDWIREETRSARVGDGLESALRDARYAARGLLRSPGFAAATILTLALGIGANTAIFSVVNAMLIAPLPYRDSGRLVFVWSDMSQEGYPRAPLSGPELEDLRRRAAGFSGFGAIWANTATLSGDAEPEQVRIGFVTGDFFSVLGAEASRGRTVAEGDDEAEPRIVLSDALWRRRFGGDPAIVGRRILVNGEPTTGVGGMPSPFRLLLPPDSAVPDDLEAWKPFWPKMTGDPRGQQFLRVVGRLKPGVTLEQGRREVDAIAAAISREFTEYGAAGRRFDTVGLHADGVREIRPALLALFAGVGILLLITCVNVAGLLAARAAARRPEIALRVALGAGRGRLFRQCLVEGLVLAALGAIAGLAVARATLGVLAASRPESLRRIAAASIDGRVLAFTAATTLVWGVLLSLAPLAEVSRTSPFTALKRGGRAPSRLRASFVAVQIALGAVLVVGAGLVARTFLHLKSVDPGYRADRVLSFRLALRGPRYNSPGKFNAFSREFERTLAALPGVEAAGAVSHLPFDHIPNWGGPYLAAAAADPSAAPMADYRAVTPGFFATVGARLVAGRNFDEADTETGAPVAIVDERLAGLAWPGEDPIGRRLQVDPRSSGRPEQWVTVVGVVRHLRDRALTRDVREQIYFPLRQVIRNPSAYVLRAAGDPAALVGPIRRTLARMDPSLPISEVRPLADWVAAASDGPRFTAILAAAFAGIALLLACAGLYGVVAYSVAQRKKELGIRLALGALPRQVRTLVLSEGLAVTAAGLFLGLPAAAVAARLLRAQLFGVTPGDARTYLTAAGVLGLAAVLSAWHAARRATGASPLEVLRAD